MGVPMGTPIGISIGIPMGVPMGTPMGIPMGISMGIAMGIPMCISMGHAHGYTHGYTYGNTHGHIHGYIPMGIPRSIPIGIPMGISMGRPWIYPWVCPCAHVYAHGYTHGYTHESVLRWPLGSRSVTAMNGRNGALSSASSTWPSNLLRFCCWLVKGSGRSVTPNWVPVSTAESYCKVHAARSTASRVRWHHLVSSSSPCSVALAAKSCFSRAARVLGTEMIFSWPCVKPRPCASKGFTADRGISAMPIWALLAKSSSRAGSSSLWPYFVKPMKAFMQSSSECTSSSIRRKSRTCSIGCLANARCMACSVGMHGTLCSRLTSRLPKGSPAPFMSVTVIGEYMSAKFVVRKIVSGPS